MKLYRKIPHLNTTLIIMLLMWCSAQLTYAEYFRNLGVKDGLAQVSVMAIHQDFLGRMWFGTMEGLSIYDGASMKTIKGGVKEFEAFANKGQIYMIVEDANHDIFLKAEDALIKYDFKKGKFQNLRPSKVTSVASINGEIFISANDSILRCDSKDNNFRFYLKTNLSGTINRIFLDSKSTLWIGTTAGLYKKNGSRFENVIANKNIYTIFESRNGELWIGTRREGMCRIDKQGNVITYTHNPQNSNTISSNQVRTFAEDRAGNIWIGTFTGLNRFSPATGKFTVYAQDDTQGSLLHSSVYSLLRDKQGLMWIGTYYGGVSIFNPDVNFLTYYSVNPKRKDCLNFPFVGNITEDKRGNVWICTEGGGLNFLNRQTQQFLVYSAENTKIKQNNLKSICYDEKEDVLYIGSYMDGLTRYDLKNNRFKNFIDEPILQNAITQRNIPDVKMYRDNLLFLSGNDLYKLDTKTDEITSLLTTGQTAAFIIDSKNNAWILGLTEIIRVNLEDRSKKKVFKNSDLGLGNFGVSCLYEAPDGNIYFGTLGSGILEYDYKTDSFSTYTARENNLLGDYCYSISRSKQGLIIVLGDKGISFFDTKSKKVQHSIGVNQLPTLAFNEGNGLFAAHDGNIYVGSTNGMLRISETELYTISKNASLYFTELFINNKKVESGDDSKILSEIIGLTKRITLKYRQNNFALSFAGNDYENILSASSYEYMLEGFDKEWITAQSLQANYTNVNPGKYVLRVREKNIDKSKTTREAALKIVVKQPLYNTFWAWLLYISFVSAAVYLLYTNRMRQMRLRQSLEDERREKENIEELNRFKVAFFTNISHELRTPLTLIITQIEILLNQKELSKNIHDKVKKLYSHTHQLRNLVSEFLDFQKAELRKLHLKVQEQNIVDFLKEVFLSFTERAHSLQIKYDFSTTTDNIPCYFDQIQLQKVFVNLISNAFKYTAKDGFVKVAVAEEDEQIIVRILDNGAGIDKEDLNKIFERFYQSSAGTQISNDASSGIGLALSKDIVELHQGEISVESKPDYGSVFVVKLKKGTKHFENNADVEIVSADSSTVKAGSLPDTDFMELISDLATERDAENNEKQKYTILLVEDNKDLLSLLVDVFSPIYNVLTATNGAEGLQKTLDEKPDIVLSDIMMPEMSGNEMCMKLKTNILTSHIPVVLLTARTSSEQQVEGLLKGADDYITKPFDAKVLLVKINTILRNRELLRASFKKEPDFHSELLAHNELDQKFLKIIEESIEKNIENPDFDVEKLSQETAMGRSSFFEKMKALTGMTPANFILTYRLRRAATLLETYPSMQVTDIAYQLGFNTGKYFSICFKNHFNVSPMKYREMKRQSLSSDAEKPSD